MFSVLEDVGTLVTNALVKQYKATITSLYLGTSSVVQWIKLRLLMQGEQVQSMVEELTFHVLWGAAKIFLKEESVLDLLTSEVFELLFDLLGAKVFDTWEHSQDQKQLK